MSHQPDAKPLDAWLAESLRVTVFPSPAASLTDQRWWEQLVGQPPETQTSQPRKGGRKDEGPYEGGKLVLDCETTRIDWHLVPAAPSEETDQAFPNIGTYPESLALFSQLIRRWLGLDDFPPINRLAVGSILLHPVDSLSHGYRQLTDYLPSVQIDPNGSSDFQYQINRPRESRSGVSGLRINRLSKWSVATIRLFTLTGAGPSSRAEAQHHARRLQLDVNTAAEFDTELPADGLIPLLQELVELAGEIASHGDIP